MIKERLKVSSLQASNSTYKTSPLVPQNSPLKKMLGGDFYFPKIKKSLLQKNIILTPATKRMVYINYRKLPGDNSLLTVSMSFLFSRSVLLSLISFEAAHVLIWSRSRYSEKYKKNDLWNINIFFFIINSFLLLLSYEMCHIFNTVF